MPSEDEKNNAIVVITVGKKTLHPMILGTLKQLGYKNIILASDIFEYHLSHAPLWLDAAGTDYYREHRDQIFRAVGLFADEESRSVFVRLLQTYLHRIPIHIPNRPITEQYFPSDVTLKKGYARTINCGSYDGDTVKQLNALHGKIDALACFEPDEINFRLLSDYLAMASDDIASSIVVFPCGVSNRTTQYKFKAGNAVNSSIADDGDSVIQCVALDDVLPGYAPTFVNMDVESAELDALMGAATLIRENRPDLAICVYHTPGHLWEIPLYIIESLHANYRLYLRNYTGFPAETVLYATE